MREHLNSVPCFCESVMCVYLRVCKWLLCKWSAAIGAGQGGEYVSRAGTFSGTVCVVCVVYTLASCARVSESGVGMFAMD